MDEILDEHEIEKNEVKTQWLYIFCFSFVYAIYTKSKWLIVDELWFLVTRGVLELIIFIFLIILISVELCTCIFLLRKRYLSKNSGDAFYTSLLFLMIAYLFFFLLPYEFSIGALPSYRSMFSSFLTILLVSVPISLVTAALVKFITVNYMDKNSSWTKY